MWRQLREIRVGIAEGGGDNLFGGAEFWPNGPEAGAEESAERVGCGGGEDPEDGLGDDPIRMWRWQAAILRRTGFRQACDLWWLAVRTGEKIVETRWCVGAGTGWCVRRETDWCVRKGHTDLSPAVVSV